MHFNKPSLVSKTPNGDGNRGQSDAGQYNSILSPISYIEIVLVKDRQDNDSDQKYFQPLYGHLSVVLRLHIKQCEPIL